MTDFVVKFGGPVVSTIFRPIMNSRCTAVLVTANFTAGPRVWSHVLLPIHMPPPAAAFYQTAKSFTARALCLVFVFYKRKRASGNDFFLKDVKFTETSEAEWPMQMNENNNNPPNSGIDVWIT